MTSKDIVSGSVAEVTTGYSAFIWIVHDFHLCNDSCCDGKSITSPEFITKNMSNTGQQSGENVWKLKLYSTQYPMSFDYYLSICLTRENSHDIETNTYVSISILDSMHNKVRIPNSQESIIEFNETEITFLYYIKLANISEQILEILHRGHLRLLCELSTVNQIGRMKIENELESLSNDLAITFQDKNTSDVVIVVGDEKFYAHKAILMSRSSVFRAMFENDMKEKRENTVNITNFDSNVIQEMLRFIYTGKVKNTNGFEEKLLSAADQYELESLKITCANILSDNLKVENACEMIALANQYKLTQFRNEVLEFIAYNVENIIDS